MEFPVPSLAIVMTLFFAITLATAFLHTALPTVQFSWSQQQCVAVFYSDGTEGSCAALPEKYQKEWVK